MDLSDSPGRPACPSRASGWSSLTTPWGLPCCARFPCVHAVATTPAQRLGSASLTSPQSCQPSPTWQSGRPVHRHFEACSAFTRVKACTLALSPYIVTGIPRLQPVRYLGGCSGCFRLERLPGGICIHWKAPPCHGARQEPPLALQKGWESFACLSRHRRLLRPCHNRPSRRAPAINSRRVPHPYLLGRTMGILSRSGLHVWP
jgi:hypothetical protein